MVHLHCFFLSFFLPQPDDLEFGTAQARSSLSQHSFGLFLFPFLHCLFAIFLSGMSKDCSEEPEISCTLPMSEYSAPWFSNRSSVSSLLGYIFFVSVVRNVVSVFAQLLLQAVGVSSSEEDPWIANTDDFSWV